MYKNDFGDSFARFHPDCWDQTQNLENEFRHVKFQLELTRKNVELASKKFDFLELELVLQQLNLFTVQFSSFLYASCNKRI